ncbi:glycosyltransferase family 2 protein [Brucella pseudogrignonensis]|uniref:glycosyltransferase family 2 protein n=1 Tax=Brucella pseudogrignonensis TaxID=419475 RepID=UPI0038B4346B
MLNVKNSAITETRNIVVVIPFYNGSKFIKRSVESVLRQTVPAAEIVVVNDGSSAEETNFLHDFAKNYPIRVIDKANGGQGSARNAGVAASTSPYICFLDQDDYYLEWHNEVLLNAVPEHNIRFGWVYADLYEAEENGKIVTTAIVKHYGKHPKTDLRDILRNDMHILPSASLISRTAFEEVGGFDEQFTGYEDDDLFIRLFRAGFTNTFVPDAVTAWCVNSGSTSFSTRMSKSRFRFFKKMVSEYPDDWFRGKFFLRDCFVPRFHNIFIGDAMMSIIRDRRVKIELYNHYDELMEIAESYSSIVFQSDSISTKSKLRLKLQLMVLRTKNRLLVAAAQRSLHITRRMMRLFNR